MKANYTDITIVLDRSGSMDIVAADTIGGFNKFVDDQKSAPGTATLTLHQFDDRFETVEKSTDIKSVKHLNSQTFVPRGSTALLDAVGRAVVDTGSRIEAMAEQDRPSKVVFVIITDGHENASHEYTHQKVLEMISHQRNKYSWEFVFLGANIDAKQVAGRMGIDQANAMKFAYSGEGTQGAFASTSSNLRSMRVGAKLDMSYTKSDEDAQLKAGVSQS